MQGRLPDYASTSDKSCFSDANPKPFNGVATIASFCGVMTSGRRAKVSIRPFRDGYDSLLLFGDPRRMSLAESKTHP